MKSDVVKRKMKIFINGLQKNDPEIMPDPPVKYLKNDKCNQMYRLFSTTFIYVYLNTGVLYKSPTKSDVCVK